MGIAKEDKKDKKDKEKPMEWVIIGFF